MLTWFTRPRETLEAQLGVLAECGLAIERPWGIADVRSALTGFDRGLPPYLRLLLALGQVRNAAARTPPTLCPRVLQIPARCIDGPGAYGRLFAGLARMLGPEFPARDGQDVLSQAERRGSLSFEIGDVRHHWTLRVMDDWVDETLLVRVNHMLEEHGGRLRLRQVPVGEHHLLLVAATSADSRRCAQRTGLALREIL